ncbi:UNVERIFIED_CONTAM: Beta-amylase 2, chloroplastic [Sesamum latifolium]|uniref:Beta-amylase n=1 Tax=Sesamum latifolium TaxID=2727402 RepID=A0AAW2WLE5_9LAMI
MAVSIPSVELPRTFPPLGAHNFVSSVPPVELLVISAKVSLGRRSTGKWFSGKLSSVFKFCTPSRAMVGGSGQKFANGIAISASRREVTSIIPQVQGRDFTTPPYVPVYVKLPKGVINRECKLVDPDYLINQLKILKSIEVDGVKVDCWWGIVEARGPQQYNWGGYKELFQIVRDLKFKLQVVMSFHECGNIGDDVYIPLPQWLIEIGSKNPDIFFTDKEEGETRNVSLGESTVYFDYMESFHVEFEEFLKDKVITEIEIGLGPCGELRYPSHPVKHGWKYPGIGEFQVYFDYMESFHVEFEEFFKDGVISEIEIGLGPCGELRYPSYPVKHGWKYPGIGEFQFYDKYLIKSLEDAAKVMGGQFCGRKPEGTGSYNSKPHETKFFSDYRSYDGFFGRFFLSWYSQVLIDHGDQVLAQANIVFQGTPTVAKLPCIHWWYKSESRAAELTAGFYNITCQNGYVPIALMLKKHKTALNIIGVELRTLDQYEEFPEVLANPEGLVWQVLNGAWNVGIPVEAENALPCYGRQGFDKILQNAKPYGAPDEMRLSSFTYLRLSPDLVEGCHLREFERFVKQMHGKSVTE